MSTPESSHSSLPNFNEELQQREPQYGEGITQRVWEVAYRDVTLGINMGDITFAPTEAIMCPTTPWLELGGGAIENAIADAVGEETFNVYNKRIKELLTRMRNQDSSVAQKAASEFITFLKENTGVEIQATTDQIIKDIIQATRIDIQTMGETIAISYGISIPAPSGTLSQRGIKMVILTNVTPKGRSMTMQDMEMFTYNAAQAASLARVKSLTIPAIGTGFAAAFGFGLSMEQSMQGFFKGATRFIDDRGTGSILQRIDYNIYASPKPDSGSKVSEFLRKKGIVIPLLQQ